MSMFSDAYAGRNDFNFVRTWKSVGIVSTVLVLISIVLLMLNGLNLSIDFEGGSIWEVPSKTLSIAEAQKVMAGVGKDVGEKYQEATTSEGVRVLRVSGRVSSIEQSNEVAAKLADAAGIDRTDVAITTVGPSWGKDITRTARNSLIIFFIVVALYIGLRLEPKMAVSALIGVIHDILITVGFYALFQFEVSPATMVAFLTILGFSLYDTIVVDDRLKENATKFGRTGKYTYTTLVRRSLNEVIMRSVNTTLVTIVPVLVMLILGSGVFGEKILGDFSLALLVGLTLGAYSSLYVSTPLTAVLKEREERWIEIRRRIEAKGGDPDDTRWVTEADETVERKVAVASGVARQPDASAAPPLTTNIGGHPPRPRKKRR
ncbi:MAG: protein translocase subunit SecF [Microthrixaceae bacterium]